VAHAGILEENDRLRQAVIAEERAKWEAEKDQFLSKELEGERMKITEEKERAEAKEKLLQGRTEQLEKER